MTALLLNSCQNLSFTEPVLYTSLTSHNVIEGGAVSFKCTAAGPGVEIVWYYNGNQYTKNRSDCLGQSVCVETLAYRTSAFNYVTSSLKVLLVFSNGIVNCTVDQTLKDGFSSNISSQNVSETLQLSSVTTLTVIPGQYSSM